MTESAQGFLHRKLALGCYSLPQYSVQCRYAQHQQAHYLWRNECEDFIDEYKLVDGLLDTIHGSCLREHLQLPELWEKHKVLMEKHIRYESMCSELTGAILSTGKGWSVQLEEDFVVPALRFICDIEARLRESEDGEMEYAGIYHLPYELLCDGNKLVAQHMHNDKEKYTILTADKPSKYVDKYRKMTKQIFESEMADNLATLYEELSHSTQELRHYLEELLIRRDYLMYTCRLCPGQPPQSP